MTVNPNDVWPDLEKLERKLEALINPSGSTTSKFEDKQEHRMVGVDDEEQSEEDEEDDEDKDSNDWESENEELQIKAFYRILQDICSLINNASVTPDFQGLLARADGLVNRTLDWGYGDTGIIESSLAQSFAHSDSNPVLDPVIIAKGTFAHGDLEAFTPFYNIMMGRDPHAAFEPPPGKEMPLTPPAWSTTIRPHPLSSVFSRFKNDVEITPTPNDKLAKLIYDARCEITDSLTTHSPHMMVMSPNSQCLALGYMAGWKNRIPRLRYFLLDDAGNIPEPQGVKLGHTRPIEYIAFDESRKLIFAADMCRVKSYRWGPLGNGDNFKSGFPIHTMNSNEWSGPLQVFPDGKLIRGGKGSAGVWNLDSLQTHGQKGIDRIGDDFDIEETSRDDPDNIEASSGSVADQTIKFSEDFNPSIWHPHPSISGVMLSGAGMQDSSRSYSFVSLDLGHGGKVVTRYLGHGEEVKQVSTAQGDPNIFATACMDGYTRLWDVRRPTPVLTIDIGRRQEGSFAVALANPDGLPTLFTGSGRQEVVTLFDIRARTPVYELSTGNNAVVSLVWDASCHALWAATAAECKESGYRRANIPPGQQTDWDEHRRWPIRAYHAEDYFGIVFDTNEDGHRLYRYKFKENPDTSIIPTM